jgi:hypothetical protein
MKFNYAEEDDVRFGTRRGRGRGRARARRWAESRTSPEQRQQVRAWVAGRVPPEWGVVPGEVRIDDDEILVVAHLPAVDLPGEVSAAERQTAESARIGGFREETRDRRMQIADEAATASGRIVSWGATCGETTLLFTTASLPMMTRLRIDERLVLDTLVDAGVARSRSDALAWCVRLVGRNEDQWISDLRSAFEHVEEVRSRGPSGAGGSSD